MSTIEQLADSQNVRVPASALLYFRGTSAPATFRDSGKIPVHPIKLQFHANRAAPVAKAADFLIIDVCRPPLSCNRSYAIAVIAPPQFFPFNELLRNSRALL